MYKVTLCTSWGGPIFILKEESLFYNSMEIILSTLVVAAVVVIVLGLIASK